MSLTQQREKIVQRIMEYWPSTFGPYFLDNFPGPMAPSDQFTEINIMTGIRRQESVGGLGQACLRTRSILQFTVYSPQNVGVDKLDEVCDFIHVLFLQWETILQNGSKLSFQVPYTLNRGKGSGRYTRVVSCPFYLEEHF
jgi:hypothetical protein